MHPVRLQFVPQIGAATHRDAQYGQAQNVSVRTHQPSSSWGIITGGEHVPRAVSNETSERGGVSPPGSWA